VIWLNQPISKIINVIHLQFKILYNNFYSFSLNFHKGFREKHLSVVKLYKSFVMHIDRYLTYSSALVFGFNPDVYTNNTYLELS